MLFAILAPIVVCSVGSFIYFLYAAIQRRERILFLFAALYIVLFGVGGFFMEVDPTDPALNANSLAEDIGVTFLVLTPIVAAAHGGVLASRPGDSPRSRELRIRARQFVAQDPAAALRMCVGRPELPRSYDDGGLVDLNHASSPELAGVRGISPDAAQRIVINRQEKPFAFPEELVLRGLLSTGRLHRASSWLVCVPAAPRP
jgi:SARP family transcriptional regulator, regulator of embCAB operon